MNNDGVTLTHSPQDVIAAALAVLCEPGQVYELRALNTSQGTRSGYFSDLNTMARAAAQLSGKAGGVYFSLNPTNPDLLARANNRIKDFARETTKDAEIVHRRLLGIDCDPVRPAGISSTDIEHEAAIALARECSESLSGIGWPSPMLVDSGNGCHLIYAIDLPNDEGSKRLLEKCLKALAHQLDNEAVRIDPTVFNSARVWKIPGTMACKGDSTPSRPHRASRILETPNQLEPVPPELLQQLAAQAPEPQKRSTPPGNRGTPTGKGDYSSLDIVAWFTAHGAYGRPLGGGKHTVDCPWISEHSQQRPATDADTIVYEATGVKWAGFYCHHAHCAHRRIQDVIELWGDADQFCSEQFRPASGRVPPEEPDGWGDIPTEDDPGEDDKGASSASWARSAAAQPTVEVTTQSSNWPEPMAPEAFHGLAGEIVVAIRPNTEADDVAILTNLLAFYGNVIHSGTHAMAEARHHGGNLFIVTAGETSKARKGSATAQIMHLFSLVAEEWIALHVTSGLSSGEGLIHQVRDPIYEESKKGERICVDEGVADKRLLIIEEEFASVLKVMERPANILSTTLRQAWDTGNLRTLVKNSPTQATGAHVSILGHITKNELLRHLNDTEAGNGFANRFLWACVRRSKYLPEGGDFPRYGDIVTKLHDAIERGRLLGRISRDQDSKEAWAAIYPDLSEGQPGLFGAVTARAEAQVLRLSVIYAALDGSTSIKLPHLTAGLAVWKYCESSCRYIFGDATGDPVADRIYDALAVGAMTRTEIYNLFGRNVRSERVAQALNLLITLKRVTCERRESGGRPTEVFSKP